MNSKQLLAISAAAFALLGTAGAAHAETYEGVHAITSAATRADVRTEAVAAARNGNVYSDAAAEGTVAVTSTVDRQAVRAEAVATARSGNIYSDAADLERTSVSVTRQAGL
ncbi:alpha/beta hydrolase [Variovorax sp. YR752]|uniref:alpha/beta hydrolase n=1 Tax=Variovorax sp. YR752 TaxID=1884383 RepID=UPI00313770C7